MKKEEINDWLQVFGLAGVIISLVFVGWEIKQSRDIAIADISTTNRVGISANYRIRQ
jgi:hypothetical protein